MKRKNDGDWFPLSSDFPTHRKTLHLCELLANDCADCYPIRLMAWLRDQENVDGAFRSEAEVEMVARWKGERGVLVAALRTSGFLEGLAYHNWKTKGGSKVQQMLAERRRSDRRRDRGQTADRPRTVHGKREREKETEKESKNDTPPKPPQGGGVGPEPEEPDGFAAFWEAWPPHKRKAARAQCAARWRGIDPDADTQAVILKHLEACRTSWDWTKNAGEYIPAPLVYLNQRRWEAEPPGAAPPTAETPRSPRQSAEDEMRSVLWGKEE